jgi:hypothetical protein
MPKRGLALVLTVAMGVAVALLLPSHPAAATPTPTPTAGPPLCKSTGPDGACIGEFADPESEGPATVVECPDAPDAQCSRGVGWWDQRWQCYATVASRGPGDLPTIPVVSYWRGAGTVVADTVVAEHVSGFWTYHVAFHRDDPDAVGVALACLEPLSDYKAISLPFWWAPSGDPAPSGPEFEAAATASIAFDLTAPGLGVFPGGLEDPAYPEASGAVGMPVWLWAEDPGPGVGSKLVKSAELRGYPISIEVSLSKIVYDMGNGDTVTCGLGTEPVAVHKPRQSPTCPYSYMEKGRYTVSADTVFEIEWSSTGGRQGVFPFTLTRSGVYNVGEIQVPITSGG